jgi:hypothetical protein
MAFATLGAHEVLVAHPENRAALELIGAAADVMVADVVVADVVVAKSGGEPWPWPEPRLTYANAVLPDAMMAAGTSLGRQGLVDKGLDLLGWLLSHETTAGHLSVTPVGGSSDGDSRPAFDQQPIEVAALADACARAAALAPGDPWTSGMEAAVAWFQGDNDADSVMWDPATGGGYDGLRPDGPNLNQGAESTLALISTFQHGWRLAEARR